jgi:hypothetical protein
MLKAVLLTLLLFLPAQALAQAYSGGGNKQFAYCPVGTKHYGKLVWDYRNLAACNGPVQQKKRTRAR